MGEPRDIELAFPFFGVEVARKGFNQRPGTTPLGVNVRGYDTSLRHRGGTRPGLTPFLGRGSTAQVNNFNPIQHLACIVTTDLGAIVGNTFSLLTVRMNYSETDSPPARNAPQVETPLKWFTDTKPTFPGVSGVLSPPDGGGTGQGTCSFKLSTDGTTVSLTATFISAGFAGPYFYAGNPQVFTVTQSNANFFNPAVSQIASNWTVVSGSFIGTLIFNVFFPGP